MLKPKFCLNFNQILNYGFENVVELVESYKILDFFVIGIMFRIWDCLHQNLKEESQELESSQDHNIKKLIAQKVGVS